MQSNDFIILINQHALIIQCREITKISPQELSRDSSSTRGYATFLVELAEKIPAVINSNISLLISHLDGEVILTFLKFNS